MIVCLGIGFVSGYLTKQVVPESGSSSSETTVIDEAYQVLNDNWYNASGKEVDIQGDTISALVASLGINIAIIILLKKQKLLIKVLMVIM
ncbi:hypothetical protein SD457_24150 [Coprobacillaceae bacterium CR2/5/TPMF4]|nr:hypothetical protein SD457_24150 [Coprobacillaceae bacterium CR2/5/TPMF4]